MARRASNSLALVVYAATSYVYYRGLVVEQAPPGVELDPVVLKSHQSFGGRWKYLTSLDLAIQQIYFVFATFNALLLLFDLKISSFNRLLNTFYVNFVFPMGTLVVVVFWVIFLIDRELIMPKVFDVIIPWWKNHIIHTLPFFTALMDNFFTQHYYDKSFFKGVIPTVLFSVGYMIWLHIAFFNSGFWAYPFLDHLPLPFRLGFFAVVMVFAVSLYKLGQSINSKMWNKKTKSK